MITNCKNCGAPLRSDTCDYCGTVYRDSPRIRYEIDRRGIDTLTCRTSVDLEYSRYMSEAEMAQIVKSDLTRQMTEKLVDYMDIETWVDPLTLTQVFGGRIKVMKPY